MRHWNVYEEEITYNGSMPDQRPIRRRHRGHSVSSNLSALSDVSNFGVGTSGGDGRGSGNGGGSSSSSSNNTNGGNTDGHHARMLSAHLANLASIPTSARDRYQHYQPGDLSGTERRARYRRGSRSGASAPSDGETSDSSSDASSSSTDTEEEEARMSPRTATLLRKLKKQVPPAHDSYWAEVWDSFKGQFTVSINLLRYVAMRNWFIARHSVRHYFSFHRCNGTAPRDAHHLAAVDLTLALPPPLSSAQMRWSVHMATCPRPWVCAGGCGC